MPRSCSSDNASNTDEQQHRHRRLEPVVVDDDRLLAVGQIGDRGRRVLGPRSTAGQQIDLAVRLEGTGGEHDHDEQQRGAEQRERHRPEAASSTRAVDRRRFVQILRDALQRRGHEDEREAEARPHARHRDRRQRRPRVAQQTRVLDDREQVADPLRRSTARRSRAGEGTATSGWRPRPTWPPSTRTRRGTGRLRATTCRRGPPVRLRAPDRAAR